MVASKLRCRIIDTIANAYKPAGVGDLPEWFRDLLDLLDPTPRDRPWRLRLKREQLVILDFSPNVRERLDFERIDGIWWCTHTPLPSQAGVFEAMIREITKKFGIPKEFFKEFETPMKLLGAVGQPIRGKSCDLIVDEIYLPDAQWKEETK